MIASRLAALLAAIAVLGCAAPPARAPLPLARHVDLPRFMGDWHVIAATPTLVDRHAYGAVESYRLEADGSIGTTYTFRDGAFDGPERRLTLRGFVRDSSGAVWGMRWIWPIEADYRIAYLADDYGQVVVAREKRDYAWIMARAPRIPEPDLARLVQRLADAGYDTSKLRRVPQRAAAANPSATRP